MSRSDRVQGRNARSRGVVRRQLRLEQLCDRRVLAAITGMVFEDADQSRGMSEGEAGLEDRLVYLDLNQDGSPGMGEPLERTDANGQFSFDGLAVGDYVVRLYNGSLSQQQTTPVQPTVSNDVIQIADVELQTTSFDGSFAYGLESQSIVQIDVETGTHQQIALAGVPKIIQPLPDGKVLVLGDSTVDQAEQAWLVDFDSSSTTAVDLGLQGSEQGWSSVALDATGHGFLVADAGDGISLLRSLVYDDGVWTVDFSPALVYPGASVSTNPDATASLFANQTESGFELSLLSNATGTVIDGASGLIEAGVSVDAFDDASGIVVVQNNVGDRLVLDAANNFALLGEVTGIESAVTLDGERALIFGLNRESDLLSELVVYDIAQSRVVTSVPVSPSPSGGLVLVDGGNRMLMGGAYAVLQVEFVMPTGHSVELATSEASVDLLFGLFVKPENEAPAFSTSPSFLLNEDTVLHRNAPALLSGVSDADGDQFILLKVSNPVLGNASVSPSGGLTYQPYPNVNGADGFQVIAHDGRSASEPENVFLGIDPVNDGIGIFEVTAPPVPENVGVGVPLAIIVLENPDVGEAVNIWVVGNEDFEIQNGELVLAEGAELDFENNPIFTVTIAAQGADDEYPVFSPVLFQVTDVNEPVYGISFSAYDAIPENETIGNRSLGLLFALDEDFGGDYTYTVEDERFEVVDDILRLKDGEFLDYETDHLEGIEVTVSDGEYETSETIELSVIDVNEAPTEVSFLAYALRERVAGAVVGTIQIDDPDQPATAYATVNDDRFEVVGEQLKLRDGISVLAPQEINLVIDIYDDSVPAYHVPIDVSLTVESNPNPYHNPLLPADVNADGSVQPVDALEIINYLNRNGPGPLDEAITNGAELYFDVNADDFVTPLDALLVINHLNRNQGDSGTVNGSSEGEGEGEAPEDGDIALNSAPQGEASEELPASQRFVPLDRAATYDQAVQSYFLGLDDKDEKRDDDEKLFLEESTI